MDNALKLSKDAEYWSLYTDYTNDNGAEKKLEPLRYSNGKTQEDVVREVVQLIHKGKKVILIHGVCGTGKSAIALNVARMLGKASIVVPVKNLQKQYADDYMSKKYVLNSNGKKMKIAVITGRDNHDSVIQPGVSCADPFLPDTILITEKNRDKILEYYNQNPFIQHKDIDDIRWLRRISIAPANPYWSPIVPVDIELNQLKDAKKKSYKGVGGEHVFYHRKEGCSYYDQFQAYLDADVIIFNSAKYEIEMAMGRKPETEVDIIDEADKFLDDFSKDDSLNLTRLANSLQNLNSEYKDAQYTIEKLRDLVSYEIKNKTILGIEEDKIFPLNETITEKILRLILNSDALQAELVLDDRHYTNRALEIALHFEDLFEDTYLTYNKDDEKNLYAHLVTTNVAKRFAELCLKTKALVLMSGTLHSEDVLRNVFGINDFAVVEAETKMPGTIDIVETGYELNCDYKTLNSSESKRKEYLTALSTCMEKAEKPIVVHVNAFEDLPSEQEIKYYLINNVAIKNIISREKLREEQMNDKKGEDVSRFKAKLIDTLFSTKCSRGVDFPGDICNTVIFTKYPNPNIQDIFWKVLKRTHPAYFWRFYRDKARREFLQRIYRALRSHNDHVYIMSPDLRVLDAAKKLV